MFANLYIRCRLASLPPNQTAAGQAAILIYNYTHVLNVSRAYRVGTSRTCCASRSSTTKANACAATFAPCYHTLLARPIYSTVRVYRIWYGMVWYGMV